MPEYYLVLFLMGVIYSISSGSISLNYRKNGVLNFALVGITYFGVVITGIIGKLYGFNPYWSLPICIFLGGLGNFAINIGYLDMIRRRLSGYVITGISLLAMGGLYLLSRILWTFFHAQFNNPILPPFLVDADFTLFNIAGVLIISTATLVFSNLFQYALKPVIDEETRPFSKWDIVR